MDTLNTRWPDYNIRRLGLLYRFLLKQKLADTDYIITKPAEGVIDEGPFQVNNEARSAWGKEINGLPEKYCIND